MAYPYLRPDPGRDLGLRHGRHRARKARDQYRRCRAHQGRRTPLAWRQGQHDDGPYHDHGGRRPGQIRITDALFKREAAMLGLWVKVRVKPEARERFLKAIEVDALGSERDEPGCLRFNVLHDKQDPNVYYFFAVYRGGAAIE